MQIGGGALTPDELTDRLLDYAVRAGHVVDALPETRLGRHIASQLVRSATSPAPNYDEGCAAESTADFAHKLNVALKEMRESRLWLRMILRAQLLREVKVADLLDEADQLCRILGKSVVTARRNTGKLRRPRD
jgi:four helix bundle protein